LCSAGAYELIKNRHLFTAADVPMFLVGAFVSFLVALVVIRALIRYVATNSLTPFAWYRIAFGVFILAAWQFGWIKW
jgi:undecaprenyl-diphosphatase